MARALCLDCEGDFEDQDGLCPLCSSARIDFTTYAEDEEEVEYDSEIRNGKRD